MSAALTYALPRRRGEADTLVRQYLPLVKKLAWHVHGSMSTLVDMSRTWCRSASSRWSRRPRQAQDQGAHFRAYLVTRLRGAMIDELRRQATTTRGAMRRRRAYHAAVATLTQRLGHAPRRKP